VSEARLKTGIWVQACVRRGDIAGITVTVVHRGDADGGAVLVKLNRRELGCTVLAETRDPSGARAWIRGTGAAPVAELEADAYIARNRGRDPDLWVLEVDDRAGRLPFDATII
jgi:GMP synthase (glutamine-hydrolysing)